MTRIDLDVFDPFAPEHRADPHPGYHYLRRHAPVWRHPEGEWILTRYADCSAVLRDPRCSSNPSHLTEPRRADDDTLRDRLAFGDTNILLFMDPPDHTRLRKLVNRGFTRRAVERLRPRIQELVDELLDGIAQQDSAELMADLAFPLPVIVICEILGVPAEDRLRFGEWSSDASRLLDGDIEPELVQRGMAGAMYLMNYLDGLIEEHRAHPRDDLLSTLIAAEEAGDRLSEAELRVTTLLLFVAGHETTMNLIGNGTLSLLSHRDQLERLQRDPSLIDRAVEEMLRFDGPVHLTGRVPTEDIEVGGQVIAKGEQAVTLLAAANRDAAEFPDPDRFLVDRDPNYHLAFSKGMHHCLGAWLARLEGQVALGTLVRRFPDLELETTEPSYRDHFVLRGLTELRVGLR